ncbi:MAG: DUF3168 domain-containing protein [Pseudomonadota bacterium]|uniref:DUF3168 domain-containing protein n=1 Tax=Roseovarius TaxID=74030 RepID=UPI0022A7B6E6|nr:DUF3168 domain-containing protein [Roseovarius sp. EGI FJ00037]MCZ0810702.1 DUF3168 domain-containing protein [Roseovarius sp. EGI FJ00037]
MSYGVAAGLQAAIYQRLTQDGALAALVGDAIYDALPAGDSLPDTYVTLGPEDVRARGDGTGGGAWHRIIISVVTSATGFHGAKQVAGAVGDALGTGAMTLERGRLVSLRFDRARAAREGSGALRRIDLSFRARIEDTE